MVRGWLFMKVERLKELSDELTEKVKAFSENELKDFIETMSRFPTYSLRNQLLIYLQTNGAASMVCGAQKWKELGRYINKGSKAIYIVAPYYIKSITKDGNNISDNDIDPPADETKQLGFKAVPVFDVSQTNGKELPEITKPLIQAVDNYDDLLNAISRYSPVPIVMGNTGDANGYYNLNDKKIVISDRISDMQAQIVDVCIHEMSHCILHDKDFGICKDVPHDIKEVQAEASAYLTCNALGIDNSNFAVGYITSWAGGDLKEFEEYMKPVHDCSKQIIDGIEKGLYDIRLENTNEMAFRLEDGSYFHIAVVDGGYNFSLYDKKYNYVDGGQLDNLAMRIDSSTLEALGRLGVKARPTKEIATDDLMERVDNAKQRALEDRKRTAYKNSNSFYKPSDRNSWSVYNSKNNNFKPIITGKGVKMK